MTKLHTAIPKGTYDERMILVVASVLLAVPAFGGQGWYLLMPWKEGPEGVRATLTTWDHFGSFDTTAECENDLVAQTKRRDKIKELGKGTPEQLKVNENIRDRLNWARCIASDDPRLKN